MVIAAVNARIAVREIGPLAAELGAGQRNAAAQPQRPGPGRRFATGRGASVASTFVANALVANNAAPPAATNSRRLRWFVVLMVRTIKGGRQWIPIAAMFKHGSTNGRDPCENVAARSEHPTIVGASCELRLRTFALITAESRMLHAAMQ